MNNQINQWITIAKNFKSNYNWYGKSPERKEKTNLVNSKRINDLDNVLSSKIISL